MRNQRPKCNRRGLFELHTATTRRELDLATSATHSIHNDSALREPSNCHGFDVGYFDACFCFALSRQLLNRRKLHVSVTVYGTEARKAGTSKHAFSESSIQHEGGMHMSQANVMDPRPTRRIQTVPAFRNVPGHSVAQSQSESIHHPHD